MYSYIISFASVLSSGEPTELVTNTTLSNLTSLLSTTITPSLQHGDEGDICGANFCPGTMGEGANPNLAPPQTSKIHLIAGIYLGCMILACAVVFVFVDPMSR